MLRTALAFLALASPALAESHLPAIVIHDAVIFETTPVAKAAAGYLTITNDSDAPYTLTGIEAGFPRAELHESVMENDVMRMVPRPEGFDIAPGETLSLERGGRHIMFMGLDTQLTDGTEIPATLIFSDEVRIPVTFDVMTMPADPGTLDDGRLAPGMTEPVSYTHLTLPTIYSV